MAVNCLPVGSTILPFMPADESATQRPAAATAGIATASHDSGSITIDVACPDCGYNLRGLPGPIVNCPECGLRSDVPVLAARQWDKPWYRAPGFNALMWPAAWMWISFLIFAFVDATVSLGTASALASCLVVIVGWSWLMVRASRVLDGEVGVWLALLMHVLVAGYLVGLVGVLVAVIFTVIDTVFTDSSRGADALSVLYGSLALAGFALLLWGCRRIERTIAGVCIRQYLLRRPTE